MSEDLDRFELSALQQRHCRYHGQNQRLQSSLLFKLAVADTTALPEILDALAEKHEMLCTGFDKVAGRTFYTQYVDEVSKLVYDTIEVDSIVQLSEQSLADDVIAASLVSDNSGDKYLWLRASSLVADVESLHILATDISNALNGDNESLEEEVAQFLDVADWLDELQGSDDTAQNREFWQSHVRAALKTPDLPFTKLKDTDSRLVKVSRCLDEAQLNNLNTWAHDHHIDNEAVMCALWHQLLCQYAGKDELTLGVGIGGRRYDELKEVVGPLSPAVALNLIFDAQETLAVRAKWAQESLKQARANGECFNWSHYGEATASLAYGFCHLKLEDLNGFSVVTAENQQDLHGLKLSTLESDNGITLTVEYDEAYYDHDEAKGLLDLLSNTLNRELDPSHPVTAVPPASHTDELTLSRFAAVVADKPDNIALRCVDSQLTYSELDRLTNQLARVLESHGAKAGDRVLILLPRSQPQVISLLAVLKLDATYVPVDPDLPVTRIEHILNDSEATLAVISDDFSALVMPNAVKYSEAVEQTVEKDGDPIDVDINGDNLAYIIYTSGSTGVPKGVAISHLALATYLEGALDRVPLSGCESMTALSTVGADLGYTTLYGALVTGATYLVVSPDLNLDAKGLAQLFERYPVDCLKIVPSHFDALLSEDNARQLIPNKCLVLGGEPMSPELIEKIHQFKPECVLVNHYGPSEATVGVTAVVSDKQRYACGLPVGKPFKTVEAYVVDEHKQPLAKGLVGELAVCTDALATGYINREELTERQFTQLPGTDKRIYLTGDNARVWPSGAIQILGRVDNQIKINGNRIELGEIEAIIGEFDQVHSAVIKVFEHEDIKRLVAYVKWNSIECNEELAGVMHQRLPPFMQPSDYVTVENWPLNLNGKLDKSKLPEPKPSDIADAHYIGPRNEVEQAVTDIWLGLLKRERVSVQANFFDVSGNSLLLVQMKNQLEKQFDKTISVVELFGLTTIERIAQYFAPQGDGEAESQTQAKRRDRAAKAKQAMGNKRAAGRDRRRGR